MWKYTVKLRYWVATNFLRRETSYKRNSGDGDTLCVVFDLVFGFCFCKYHFSSNQVLVFSFC